MFTLIALIAVTAVVAQDDSFLKRCGKPATQIAAKACCTYAKTNGKDAPEYCAKFTDQTRGERTTEPESSKPSFDFAAKCAKPETRALVTTCCAWAKRLGKKTPEYCAKLSTSERTRVETTKAPASLFDFAARCEKYTTKAVAWTCCSYAKRLGKEAPEYCAKLTNTVETCDRDCICLRCKNNADDLSEDLKKRCASIRCPDIKVEEPKSDPCAEENITDANKVRCCIAEKCSLRATTNTRARGADKTPERSVTDIKECAVKQCGYKAPEPKCDGSADCCKALYARGVKTDACAKYYDAIKQRREKEDEKEDGTSLDNKVVRDRVAKACGDGKSQTCCVARALAIQAVDKKTAALKKCRELYSQKEDKACEESLKCKAEDNPAVRAYCVKRCQHEVETTVVPPSVDCDVKGVSSVRACVCKTERGQKLDACAEKTLGDSAENCRAKATALLKTKNRDEALKAYKACVAGENKEREAKIVTVEDGDKVGAAEVDAAKDPKDRCNRAIAEKVRNLIKSAPQKDADGEEKKFDSIGLTVSSMVKECVKKATAETEKAKEEAKPLREAKNIEALKKIAEANKAAKERREKYVAKLREAAKNFKEAAADSKAALKAAREQCSTDCEDADCKKACFKKAVVAEFEDVPCEKFEAFREKVKALDSARKAAKKFKRVFVFFNKVCNPKADAEEKKSEDKSEDKEAADKQAKRQAEETVKFTVTVTGEDAEDAATVVANLPADGEIVEGTIIVDGTDPTDPTDPTVAVTKKTGVTDAAGSASSLLMTFAAIALAICALL